jgi:hypothetical protein
MKQIFAGAALVVGLLAAATPAAAQVRPAEKCYDCPAPKVYDTQETVRTTTDVDQSRVINTQSEEQLPPRVKETNHLIVRENQIRNVGVVQHNHTIYERVPRNPATPAPAQVRQVRQITPAEKCYDCPAPREHYDSQETIHTTNDVDQSRVINTQSEAEVSRRVKQTNHLVIRENQTRNVGVVQHNHTIYERVPRYVVRVPAVTVVSFVTQRYHVVETPATMTVPVSVRPASRCSRGGRYDRYSRDDDSCRRLLRVRG